MPSGENDRLEAALGLLECAQADPRICRFCPLVTLLMYVASPEEPADNPERVPDMHETYVEIYDK